MALVPGKGFHGDLTFDSIEFLHQTITDVWNAYGEDGDSLQNEDNEGEILKAVQATSSGWTREKDNFGTKIWKEIEWQKGSYRVTVVLTKRGLKLDVRNWFDPEA